MSFNASAPSAVELQSAWRRDRWLIAFLALLAIVPLVYPSIPPLTDLPTHISRFAIVAARNDKFLSHFYDVHLFVSGNLGVDLLVLLFLPILGTELATKTVVLFIPALTMVGACRLSLALHGKVTPYAVLAGALCYSVPFHMGFVNYCMGLAIMWNAVATWLHHRNQRSGRYLAGLLGLAIWIAHAVPWGQNCRESG